MNRPLINIKRKVSINSYAKINLILKVVGKFPDNFHIIETIFSRIDLADKLTFQLTEKGNVNVLTNIGYLNGKRNIVYTIASYLKNRFHIASGVDIYIEKCIPIAAGLAGGSSNAAVALKVLNEMWKINLSNNELHKVASKFGSDLNFFIDDFDTAIGTGRGETIRKIDSFKCSNILLVNPGIEISAKEGYELRKGEYSQSGLDFDLHDYRYFKNDLEDGIANRYHKIKDVISDLSNLGAVKAMMSGSGATCFGIFNDSDHMHIASEWFIDNYGYWTYKAKTLNGA